MIHHVNLSRIRVMNFYLAMSNVSTFLAKEDLETLKLKDQVAIFNEKYKAFDDAVVPLRKSGKTDKLHKHGSERDDALIGLGRHLRLYITYPVKTMSDAAWRLYPVLKGYGKMPHLKPQREKTALISNLLQDYDTAQAKADLTLIGADKWVDILKDSNSKYKGTYQERVEFESALKKGLTQKTRDDLYEEFKRLVQRINSLALIEGEAPYLKLMEKINVEMKQANLSERPDRKKKDDPDIQLPEDDEVEEKKD